jgi:hypothetical protein
MYLLFKEHRTLLKTELKVFLQPNEFYIRRITKIIFFFFFFYFNSRIIASAHVSHMVEHSFDK